MENCWGEPPQSSGDCYPHYSLFQSSLFYDTDNIRIASLTCKYNSLTTESGIRTFEYRKSSAELDGCRTESQPKCSEDLVDNAEPMDKEDIGGYRRWYSRFRPKCCEDLTHSTEPPDKKDIKSCGAVSGPKWSRDLLSNAEPLDKEDIEGEYTLFGPLCSEEPVRSIEPLEKEDKERCRTVTGPMRPVDLAGSAEPLDKADIEEGYTLFGPKWSDYLERRIEPPDKEDIERCCTVSKPKWSKDQACSAEPKDKDDIKGGYTLFRPKWSDNLERRIEPLNKKDIESYGAVSGPKRSKDLVSNAEPLDKEDIEEEYTLFGPMCSEEPVRSLEPLNIERCRTGSWPKCFEELSRSIPPLEKKDTERCNTVSGLECSGDLACSAEPLDKENEEHAEPEPDKRIITKKELYRDPDLFQSRSEYVEPIAAQPRKPKPWGYYDWTRQIWVHKETGKRVAMNRREELDEEQRQAWGEAWREERRGEWRGMRGGSQPGHPLAEPTRIQSGVADNMTQRVGWHGGDPAPHTMTQRMGWQGGALGRISDGNHHPMTKDPNNASHNVGFGKRTSAKPKPKKLSARDVFSTNVLLFIMEFVKDDTEVQLQFDSELKQCERRQIKTMVSHIITAGNIELLGTFGQYDLVLDIQSRNQYQISVISEGDDVTRWLSIYKEAPGHVYLVTPDDFLAKEEDEETDEQSSESSINPASRDPDDDDNPFLRSIEKGLKKKMEKQCNISETKKRSESTPEEKMLEFFLEFVDSEYFTEMWFLGKFNEKQVQVINDLLNDLSTCIDDFDSFDGGKEMAKVFKSGEVQFELKEGSNGTTEIHKISANPPTEQVTQPGPQAGP